MARVSAVVSGSDVLVPVSRAGIAGYSHTFLRSIDKALEFLPENRPRDVPTWRAMLEEHIPIALSADQNFQEIATELPAGDTGAPTVDEVRRSPGKRDSGSDAATDSDATVLGTTPVGLTRKANNWLLPVIVAVLGVAVIGLGALLYLQQRDPATATPVAAATQPQLPAASEPAAEELTKGEAALAAMRQIRITIDELLASAAEDVAAKRFAEPAGKNAAERYRTVLELDPDNADARTGIAVVVNGLVDAAREAAQARRFGEAEQLLALAESVDPAADLIVSTRAALLASLQSFQENQAEQANLRRLLSDAKSAFDAGRVTGSGADTALALYRQVLALNGEDPKAIAGLEQIVTTLANDADGAIKRSAFDEAQRILDEAGAVMANSEAVIAGRDALTLARRAYSEEQQRLAVVAKKKADEEAMRRAQEEANAKRDAEIARLLASAEAGRQAKRWVETASNSALSGYRAVLELDPDNAKAKQGLAQLVADIVGESAAARSGEQFVQAAKLLAIAGRVDPDAAAISNESKALAEARDAYEKEQRRLASLQATQKRQAEIDQLLARAKQDLGAKRLTTPPGDNALARYRSVLKLDPDNQAARAGRSAVVDTLLTLATAAREKQDFETAARYLKEAQGIAPDSSAIAEQQQALAVVREAYDAALAKLAAAQQAQADAAAKQREADAQASKRGEIDALLALAADDLDALRLTSPAKKNAVERFQRVLELDPDNAQAANGLQQVVTRYVDLAGKSRARRQFDKADGYLDKALAVLPDSEMVSMVREEVRLARSADDAEQAEATALAARRQQEQEQIATAKVELKRLQDQTAKLTQGLEAATKSASTVKRVGYFPLSTPKPQAAWQLYAKLSERFPEKVAKAVSDLPGFELAYSYGSGQSDADRLVDQEPVWAGGINRHEPSEDRVYALGEKLGFSSVVMCWVQKRSKSSQTV